PRLLRGDLGGRVHPGHARGRRARRIAVRGPAVSAEPGLTIARAWFEAVSRGDVDGAVALLAPGFVQHTAGMPPGPAAARWFLTTFRAGFPDLAVEVDWMFAAGDRVVVRATTRGTHTGVFLGHAP